MLNPLSPQKAFQDIKENVGTKSNSFPTLLDAPHITFQDMTPEVVTVKNKFTVPNFTQTKPQPYTAQKFAQDFSGTTKTLAELQLDPASLKADPSKAIGDAWNAIKGSVHEAGDAWGEAFYKASTEPTTVAQNFGRAISATAKTAGALFSPISALFSAAKDIPVLGSIAKLIELPFTVVGEAGGHIGGKIVDELPISQETKDQIKPGIQEIFALAGQLVLGKGIEVSGKKYLPSEKKATVFRDNFIKENPEHVEVNGIGTNKINSLVKKYGEKDTTTIIKKAIDIGREKKAAEANQPPADPRAGFARIPESGKPNIKEGEMAFRDEGKIDFEQSKLAVEKRTGEPLIETRVPIEILKPVDNPATLDRTKVEMAKTEITSGNEPPLITENGIVSDGNHRLQAYKELGIKEVPILRPKSETTTISDATSRLVAAIEGAEKPRAKLEQKYSEVRAKRSGAVEGIFKQGEGQAGYFKALGKLKGELTEKPKFESLKLQEKDIADLFNKAQQHPTLTSFEKVTVQDGLMKLLNGEIPQEGQLALLKKVYGPELVKTVLSKRVNLDKFREAVIQILNIPKTIMSSFDFSFGGRQGAFAAPKFRKQFWSAWKQQFKMFGSQKAFEAAQEVITKDPNYELARESGVAFTDIGDLMSLREEQFMSSWAEKIPVLGRAVKGSARAYTSFANKFRMDIFSSLVEDAKKLGLDPVNDPVMAENMAKLVNNMTGRGNFRLPLGGSKLLEAAAPILNAFFFSPRLIASRINLIDPSYYILQDSFTRKQSLSALLHAAGALTTILTVASLAGADVETDCTNADFGKVKVENTRVDVAGGFIQSIVLGCRLIQGKSTSSTSGKVTVLGEGYKPTTRLDLLEQYFINKESPLASYITDLLKGQDAIGNPINVPIRTAELFIPMIAQDIADIAKDDPKLLPLSILGTFGAGIQTYAPAEKKSDGKSFGAPSSFGGPSTFGGRELLKFGGQSNFEGR